jgi:ribosomal protein L7/L12
MDNPHALFQEVIAATGDRIAAIRAIREHFGLDLRSAKEVMYQAEGTAASPDEHQARLVEGFERALGPHRQSR